MGVIRFVLDDVWNNLYEKMSKEYGDIQQNFGKEQNMNNTIDVDFSKLSVARLGEAYVNMNGWKWDEICGPKPEGFDEMTSREKYELPAFKKAFRKIRLYLTYEQMSMFWWTIELGKTYEEWREWYDEEGRRTHR